MDNVYTSTTTGQMKPPEDWDHSEVKIHPLYVSNGNIGQHKCFVTYWRPSQEEIETLVMGGAIEVILLGVQCPMQVNALVIAENDINVITDVPKVTQ